MKQTKNQVAQRSCAWTSQLLSWAKNQTFRRKIGAFPCGKWPGIILKPNVCPLWPAGLHLFWFRWFFGIFAWHGKTNFINGPTYRPCSFQATGHKSPFEYADWFCVYLQCNNNNKEQICALVSAVDKVCATVVNAKVSDAIGIHTALCIHTYWWPQTECAWLYRRNRPSMCIGHINSTQMATISNLCAVWRNRAPDSAQKLI